MKKTIATWFIVIVTFTGMTLQAMAAESRATALLKERGKELQPRITKVSTSVYVASGYSPANISMIVGTDGIVIVDAGMSPSHAEAVLKEFRQITDLPVKGIILTHGHGDHTGATTTFYHEREPRPEIYARSPFNTEGNRFNDAGIFVNRIRGARQGGFLLPPAKRINNGIALPVYPKKGGCVFSGEQLKPTRTFRDGRMKVSVAGLELDLVAAPGETDDQLYVWFAEERVLFAGDNFYQSWPNLYAIRGTAYRDVRAWIQTLGNMLAERPDHVVPGHTRPLVGKQRTTEILTNYRDAVRHVFEETIKGINEGRTPDELAAEIQLPERLRNLDYLREYYGNISWSVRSIFTGYLGWFDGNPTTLFSLPPIEEAKRMVKLAGGEQALRAAAAKALADDDAQWCAELCDHLLALNPKNQGDRNLKAAALEQLAENLVTATGRNYYLTGAQELRRTRGR